MTITALITGVTGQDGPYLARFLLEKNYRVVGTVRSYRHAKLENLVYLGIQEQVVVEELDLQDMANVIRVLKKYQPDELYNLAAQSSVGLSFEQPIGTFSFNTASVNNLLEAIRLFYPSIRFYQASSSEMFGETDKMPISIDSPMRPVSPYAVSKLASYFMTRNYRNAYGLKVCNGILFNHESYLRSENFFMKKIIRQAILLKEGKISKVTVGNLDIKRDFGYAPKYVEAMWRMLQLEETEDFLICSGKSIGLRDIVYYVFDRLGLDRHKIFEDESLFRPNEIHEIFGDNSRSVARLDWKYPYKSFLEVLDILIDEELRNWK
ncbi:MAG: GDP-mannose 4,6-dehydratase [Candidatus Riflebacteria bacterium]